MSTRALYTFIDGVMSKLTTWFNVYKHHDGYPSGAAATLTAALPYAWKEPRFEADEFACAFIAAGKASMLENTRGYSEMSGGGVRLMPQGHPSKVARKECADIEFRYELYLLKNKIMVAAFAVSAWKKYTQTWLFTCPLSEMIRTVKSIDDAAEKQAVTS